MELFRLLKTPIRATTVLSGELALQAGEKSFARAAITGLNPEDVMVLCDCFALCGVKLAIAPVAQPARLEHEKFECCVVKIVPGCEIFLAELRRSPVNHNAVLIGAQPLNCDPGPYWKYGFNALVQLPLKLDEAVEALRNACLVTVRHLRRYVRVPFATEVAAVADGMPVKCISREISAGGVALRVPPEASKAKSWVLEFLLPPDKQVRIAAMACWARPGEDMVGLLFDPGAPQRDEVKKWIESFLAA